MTRLIALALIEREGRYLVQRRRTKDRFGDMWEFPGGKIETAESPQEAAEREVREELAIEVAARELIGVIEHDYDDFRVRLHLVRCAMEPSSDVPESDTHRWLTPAGLGELVMPAANRVIVGLLIDREHGAPRG